MRKTILPYHLKTLDEIGHQYDFDLCMPAEELDAPNSYHTILRKGRVHGVVAASEYAVGLLDGGRTEDIARARDVLKAVLALQDQREDSDTFGIWPYFYEESLEEMSPPDWNMADFNGVNLLQILIDHRDKLDPELAMQTEKACINASRSIIRRNVDLGYTNIAVMGTYVTLMTGALLDKAIYEYGKKRLKRLYHHVMYHGAYEEYNSPTYSMILIGLYGLMLQHIQDSECHQMVEDLNDMAWHMIAEHYHAPMRQWVGPQFRAYTDFIPPWMQSIFELASDFQLHLTDHKEFGILDMRRDLKCPKQYLEYFREKEPERKLIRLITKGCNYPDFQPPRVEMAYIAKAYTLGSFQICDSWNQHRMLLAYLGDEQAQYCLRMRVLHDGYDYSSGLVSVVQERNAALVQLMFSDNRGDTHCTLDPLKNHSIMAEDMRLRFQVEEDLSRVSVRQENHCFRLKISGVDVELMYSFGVFDGKTCSIELSEEGNQLYLDMVLHHGERKQLCFHEMEAACAAAAIVIDGQIGEAPQSRLQNGCLDTCWEQNGHLFQMQCPAQPNAFAALVMGSKRCLDHVTIEEIAQRASAQA